MLLRIFLNIEHGLRNALPKTRKGRHVPQRVFSGCPPEEPDTMKLVQPSLDKTMSWVDTEGDEYKKKRHGFIVDLPWTLFLWTEVVPKQAAKCGLKKI